MTEYKSKDRNIKDYTIADMLNESLKADNSTDNMVSVVGEVIKILLN